MSSIDRLIARLRNNPRAARYNDLERVLRSIGWRRVGGHGSHQEYESPDGSRCLVVVRPHGDRKYVSPRAVAEVLRLLDQQEEQRGSA